jgi:hypothetical protein
MVIFLAFTGWGVILYAASLLLHVLTLDDIRNTFLEMLSVW